MSASHRLFNGGLGRVHVEDSRDYDLTGFLADARQDTVTLPATRYWTTPGLPVDQKQTPRCVGYSGRGWLNAGPVLNEHGPSADDLYAGAQQYDGIRGPHDGSNARGLCKFLQTQGLVSTYAFTRTVSVIERWVALNGPMLLGIAWYSSFDYPHVTSRQQTLTIAPDASVRGGHEILVMGVDVVGKRLRLMQSWGPYYGANGRVWMPYATLEQLLAGNGDAATPTEILKTP